MERSTGNPGIEPVPEGTGHHEALLHEAAQQMLGMRRVMRLVIQQAKARTGALEAAHVGEAQLYVLHTLAEAGRLTAGDLAARCHVADPTMSKALNHLEAHGLVARRTDPTNRRVVQVTITPEGQAVLERVGAKLVQGLAQVLHPLSDAQLRDVLRAMEHLGSLAGGGDPQACP